MNRTMIKNRLFSRMTMTCVAMILLFVLASAQEGLARQIPTPVAVRILIGEAADQGFKGMVCVGEVLRRRGSTKGFYGYKSNRVERQPKSVWDMAARAWEHSAYSRHTRGADHFENVRDFGEPWWAKYCVKVFEYKDHVFYKRISLGRR